MDPWHDIHRNKRNFVAFAFAGCYLQFRKILSNQLKCVLNFDNNIENTISITQFDGNDMINNHQ